MTTIDLLIIAVLACAVLATGAVIGRDLIRARSARPTWLEETVRSRLLVQTRDGQTLDGQLVRVDADGIVLEPARFDRQDLSGTVFIPRERIAWTQQPGPDR